MIRKLLSIYTICVFGFLYVPIMVLIAFSFNSDKINTSWKGFTTIWYSKLFSNTEIIESFKDSLLLAFFSALIASALGTLLAYAIYKFKFRGKSIVQSVLRLPVITPDIVTAIGLLTFFVFLKFTLGFYSVLIAHITFNISFVSLIVATRFKYIDKNLEDAALDLGATPFQAFRFVVVPNIFPGIIAGFLIAFILSWDDFIISFFTSGVGTTTLPVRVYSMIKMGVNPQINAISTFTIIVSLLLMFFAIRFQKISTLIRSQ